MPCLDVLISSFSTPGAKLGSKIGTRFSIIIMLILHIISYIILIYGNKFYIVIIAICLFGIGTGLSNITYMRNCWKYFPKNNGLVNGFIISSSGIFSTFLTVLADFFIINPEREKTNDGIYPKNVAYNIEKYVETITCMMAIIDVIGFLLSFDYDEIKETKEEKIKKINEIKRNSLETIDINIMTESTNTNSENINKNVINNKIKLKDVFLSKTNFKLLIICFCGFCKY